jgi:predicted DCC family thiol-disulfide oxidoreductase YuxK
MNGGQATLIYDGACGFCRRWIERVQRWDRHGLLEMVPYQSADLAARFPGVTREECSQRIHLIDARSTVYRGAAAGREVLRRLPGGWLWTLPFRIPGGLWVAERIYVWITHRWGPLGGRPAQHDSAGAR